MLRNFNNLPIGRRLNLLVVSISILTLAIVVYIALISTTVTLRNETTRTLLNQNRSIANALDQRLYANEILIQRVTESIRRDSDLSLAGLRDSIERVMRLESNILLRRIMFYQPGEPLSIFIFPNVFNGRDILPRAVEIEEVDGETPWFVGAFEAGEVAWYGPEPAYASQVNEPTVSLVYPYQDATGEDIGILWADYNIGIIRSLMRETINLEGYANETGYSFLVGQDGRITGTYNSRARSDDLAQLAANIAPEGITTLNDVFTQEAGAFAISDPLAQTGWRLITVLPDSALPALPYQTVLQIILISSVGLLVLMIVVQGFVSSAVAKPAVSLSQSALQMGAGDLRVRFGYQENRDEIGQMARVLEDMRRNLQLSYDTLEQRVVDRTAELERERQRAQTTAAELHAIYDASLSVVSEYQLKPILENFTQYILTLLQVDYCGVWLLRSNREEIRLIIHTYPDDSLNNITVKTGEGVAGLVAETGKALIIDNYSQYPRRLNLINLKNVERALCVPLIFSGETIGAVMAGRSVEGALFSEDDMRLLALFANLVSPAVRNAQLYNQLDDARRAADRANQVKTRFLASVTHELRTPLNLIINNMDFMRIGAFGDVNDDQVSRLDQTIRSAEHLLYLINDLLDVSKIDAGEMQLFIQPADLYPILEDALDSTEMLLDKDEKRQHVALRSEIQPGLPPISMDARRIRQVLFNLLSNAVKFTINGEVRLTVRQLEAPVIEFKVMDTGIGIPHDEMNKLFEAFERTERAKQLGIEGTGLGLPISRFLIQEHGGELTVESEPGVGSTFTFTLSTETSHERRSKTNTQIMPIVQEDDSLTALKTTEL